MVESFYCWIAELCLFQPFFFYNFRIIQHVFTDRKGQTNCSAVTEHWHLPTMHFEVLLRRITDGLQTSIQGLFFVFLIRMCEHMNAVFFSLPWRRRLLCSWTLCLRGKHFAKWVMKNDFGYTVQFWEITRIVDCYNCCGINVKFDCESCYVFPENSRKQGMSPSAQHGSITFEAEQLWLFPLFFFLKCNK